MTLTVKATAFIIDVKDYRENAKILDLLTLEFGRVSLICHGATSTRKGIAYQIQPNNLVSVQYETKVNRDLATMKGMDLIKPFEVFKSGLSGYAIMNWWMEVVRIVLPLGVVPNELFNLTLALDEVIQDEDKAVRPFKISQIVFGLLEHTGYSLDLERCNDCGDSTKEISFIDLREGKGYCAECTQNGHDLFPLPPDYLQRLHKKDLLDHKVNDQANLFTTLSLVNDYLQYHFSVSFKTFPFVRETLEDR